MHRSLASAAIIIVSSLAAEARADFSYITNDLTFSKGGQVFPASGAPTSYQDFVAGTNSASINNNTTRAAGTNSGQLSTSLTNISVMTSSAASALSTPTTSSSATTVVQYATQFTVTASGLYTLMASVAASVSQSANSGISNRTQIQLYDFTTNSLVFDYTKSAVGETGTLPSQVALVASDRYQFFVLTAANVGASNVSANFSGSSSATVSLTAPAAVPEPSSLVLCGLAGLMGLGFSRARRRIAA